MTTDNTPDPAAILVSGRLRRPIARISHVDAGHATLRVDCLRDDSFWLELDLTHAQVESILARMRDAATDNPSPE